MVLKANPSLLGECYIGGGTGKSHKYIRFNDRQNVKNTSLLGSVTNRTAFNSTKIQQHSHTHQILSFFFSHYLVLYNKQVVFDQFCILEIHKD